MNHEETLSNMIWNTLDKIEDEKGLMAHQIPEIQEKLRSWQDGKITRSRFYNFLAKYWDDLHND